MCVDQRTCQRYDWDYNDYPPSYIHCPARNVKFEKKERPGEDVWCTKDNQYGILAMIMSNNQLNKRYDVDKARDNEGATADPMRSGSSTILPSSSPTEEDDHIIHDLSFGPKYPGIHNPLDGTVRILQDTSGTFKYYIKIVPTEYRYLSRAVLPTNQFSVTEYFVPLKESDRSWPAVYFLYDLSPITVTIKEERRSFSHFITRLCAVLGGTFALTGMFDRWMYRLIEAATKSSNLGHLLS
eukprot:Gb_22354 [translate_table: standard]